MKCQDRTGSIVPREAARSRTVVVPCLLTHIVGDTNMIVGERFTPHEPGIVMLKRLRNAFLGIMAFCKGLQRTAFCGFTGTRALLSSQKFLVHMKVPKSGALKSSNARQCIFGLGD
jgi:hypothetical protein